ncbi:disulfide bond formation protein B [Xanthobacteraceae bacterium Astr-EGSB]|uniref:disulfide bond formation protein B n=1 Tax=Astrobacterium formosum TaxID=3069710 RepID=UPI0027AFE453|nr:disulfide bond formation protein B [Xanthobacteraceae bacterium Astr-EGSB]
MSNLSRQASPGDPSSPVATIGPRLFFAVVMAASLAALAVAVLAERRGGRADCAPCLYQLAPYVLAALIAGAAMWMGAPPARMRRGAVACAALFAFGCAVSLFREGIQQGWWMGLAVCDDPAPLAAATANGLFDGSLAALCEANASTFDGIALSTLNFFYSAFLTFACVVMAAVGEFGQEADRNRWHG